LEENPGCGLFFWAMVGRIMYQDKSVSSGQRRGPWCSLAVARNSAVTEETQKTLIIISANTTPDDRMERIVNGLSASLSVEFSNPL
jgi:hypothetical protein